MRTLTLSQQFALAKKAREYAKQNRSKPQQPNLSANGSARTAVTATSAPNGGGSPSAPASNKRKQLSVPTPAEDEGCPICHRRYAADKLKQHMSSCVGASPLPKPVITETLKAEAAASSCPTCKRAVDDGGLAQHLEKEHNSVMCDLCQKPIKLIDLKEHQLGHTGWATYTPCKIPTDRSLVGPSSRSSGYYDPSSGARIFQGGLCGKK